MEREIWHLLQRSPEGHVMGAPLWSTWFCFHLETEEPYGNSNLLNTEGSTTAPYCVRKVKEQDRTQQTFSKKDIHSSKNNPYLQSGFHPFLLTYNSLTMFPLCSVSPNFKCEKLCDKTKCAQ